MNTLEGAWRDMAANTFKLRVTDVLEHMTWLSSDSVPPAHYDECVEVAKAALKAKGAKGFKITSQYILDHPTLPGLWLYVLGYCGEVVE